MAKQDITLSLDQSVVEAAGILAAQRGQSVSEFLSEELSRAAEWQQTYEEAKARAVARLSSPLRLGGKGIEDREALHDRSGLR